MIDFDDAEKALAYLKSTDKPAAKAKVLHDGLEDQKKTVLAIIYANKEGSAAEKTQLSLGDGSYKKHLDKINNAMLDWETIRNQRKSAELQIEMWRSVNSNQRKGNV